MRPTNHFPIPIVIIGYKRPESLVTLLKQIQKINPQSLYFVLDGPKSSAEKQLTDQVSRIVTSKRWGKHIQIKRSQRNQGLRNNVVSGLNWVFSKERRAIILEDDLVPDLSFFSFCAELLDKYQKDLDIISIAGYNPLTTTARFTPYSYVFSKYIESWGWATWKRAWDLYEDNLLSNFNQKQVSNLPPYWRHAFDEAASNRVDSWAYRWQFSAFHHQAMTIVPTQNLITYSGFDNQATHTKGNISTVAATTLLTPLLHPPHVTLTDHYDQAREHLMARDYFLLRLREIIHSPLSSIFALFGANHK